MRSRIPFGSPMEHPCPECGSMMTLRPSRFGMFYGCVKYPKCNGSHGAHRDGRPLGTPATQETKDARILAHEAFDRMWKSGKMTRSSAYRWMQKSMGLTKEQAHIGLFTKEQCDTLVRIIREKTK